MSKSEEVLEIAKRMVGSTQKNDDVSVETSEGLRTASSLALDLDMTTQEVIQMAKSDEVGHIRLVGKNEAIGKLTRILHKDLRK